MFGSLGIPELMLIFVVALIVFGPRRLPEIGRTLGKAMNEFKKATDDLKNTIEREVRVDEIKQLTAPVMTSVNALANVSRGEPSTPLSSVELQPSPPSVTPADAPAVDPAATEPRTGA